VIYTVVWLAAAEEELASLWLDAASRVDVTQAANQIDQQLRHDPEQRSESRSEDQRILFVVPWGVLYRVKPLDRVVEVIHIWKFA
jgi:hypothetical protein